MQLTYHIAESLVRPKELQVGITTVWFRKNIKEEQRTDEMTGETFTMYVYEEAKLSKDEALVYLTETEAKNAANIDYISMMSGVDLP